MRGRAASFGDFKCTHCSAIVSSAHIHSGVNNRNHCPYCLWSCHLDLFSAGDRISACKAPMKPIGLTMKNPRNRYRLEAGGELLLIHECIECCAVSINRIAADDDPSTMISIFIESCSHGDEVNNVLEGYGITLLRAEDIGIVRAGLYGHIGEILLNI